jgi:hypothetical protein
MRRELALLPGWRRGECGGFLVEEFERFGYRADWSLFPGAQLADGRPDRLERFGLADVSRECLVDPFEVEI